MPRYVSLPELRTRVLQHADALNSTFFSTAELNGYINSSLSELYDLLLPTRYYYTTTNIATVASTATYALPSDFYKLVQVDLQIDSTHWATVGEFVNEERNVYNYIPMTWTKNLFMGGSNVLYRLSGTNIEFIPVPSTAGDTIRIGYIPICPTLTDTALGAYPGTLTAVAVGAAFATTIGSVSYAFVCVTAGTTGGSQPTWTATPGTVSDATVVWSFAGLASSWVTYFDSVDGWDQYVVADAASKCKQRMELDSGQLDQRKLMLKERIEEMARARDSNRPKRIQDVHRTGGWPYGFTGTW